MDVGFYLNELLMQQSEVNVPGLGNFLQARVSSYYNESDGKFYPPYHQVQFNAQVNSNDEGLVEYTANKKGISLASAKYFIEKYVTSLLQDVHTNEITAAGLGSFYMDQSQLLFRAADKVSDDPAFYGYPPVKISRLKHTEAVEEVYIPKIETPVEPEPIEQQILQPQADAVEEYQPEEEEYVRPQRTGWTIFALIVIIGIVLFGLYRYNPTIFDKFTIKPKEEATPAADTGANQHVKTTNVDIVVTDSTDKAMAPPPPIDSSKTRYEIITTATQKIETADVVIKNLKTLGINAHVVPDDPGRFFKVTVGTYINRNDAETARKNLAATGKIQKDAYILEIKPTK